MGLHCKTFFCPFSECKVNAFFKDTKHISPKRKKDFPIVDGEILYSLFLVVVL